MKSMITTLSLFLSIHANAATLNGGSILLEGVSAPNQLIITGEPAEALYNQLNVNPKQDPSAINKVMIKLANQISCSYYVDLNEYGCDMYISANGIVN